MKNLKNTLIVSTLSFGLIMGVVGAVNAATSTTVDTTIAQTQTAQLAVTGTVRAGDTAISGTANAGATVSVKRSGTEIGAATADETTGAYTVTLNSGVTLVEAEALSITATAPGMSESNTVSVTVAAAVVVQAQTAQPAVTGTVRAGDTAISGTAEAGATVSVKRSGTEIGTATADGTTGAYTVTWNSGVTVVEANALSIIATTPGKTESNAVSVTVSAALVQEQTIQPTIGGTVRAGYTMIMGTAEAGATVSVKRSGTVIGTAISKTTGVYRVTWNSGVTLVEADVLSITATAPGKTVSNALSTTVSAPVAPAAPAPPAPPAQPAPITPGQNGQYFCNDDLQWHSNMNSQQDQQWHNTQPRQSAQPSSANKRTNTMNGNGYNSNHNENRNTNMDGNHMSGSRSGHGW